MSASMESLKVWWGEPQRGELSFLGSVGEEQTSLAH